MNVPPPRKKANVAKAQIALLLAKVIVRAKARPAARAIVRVREKHVAKVKCDVMVIVRVRKVPRATASVGPMPVLMPGRMRGPMHVVRTLAPMLRATAKLAVLPVAPTTPN